MTIPTEVCIDDVDMVVVRRWVETGDKSQLGDAEKALLVQRLVHSRAPRYALTDLLGGHENMTRWTQVSVTPTRHGRESWQQRAACAGRSGVFDLPKYITASNTHVMAQAATICAGCPVRDACRSWGERTRAAGVVCAGEARTRRAVLPIVWGNCLGCGAVIRVGQEACSARCARSAGGTK